MSYIEQLAADEQHDNTSELFEIANCLLGTLKDAEKALKDAEKAIECLRAGEPGQLWPYDWLAANIHNAIMQAEFGGEE